MLGGLGLLGNDDFLQPVESGGQLPDFIILVDRQGLARHCAATHPGQQLRGFGQWPELPAQPPPAKDGQHQRQTGRNHDEMPFDILDWREGFGGGQDGLHEPAGARYLFA